MTNSSLPVSDNLAGALCYLFGWITGVIFLLIAPQNSFIRFHAWQSIAVSLVLILASLLARIIPVLGIMLLPIIGIAGLALWIFLMLKAYQGQKYKLPFVGEFAENQAG